MRYSKYFIIFTFLCFVALIGCNRDDEEGPIGPSYEHSAEIYMPLKVGAICTYAQNGTAQGEIFTDTTTITTVGTRTIKKNNKTYFVMVTSYKDSIYLRIEDNIVYEYVPLELQEIPNFDFNKEEGQVWEIFTESNPRGSMTVTGKYLGTENITVPAGTFKNCAKFESSWKVILLNNSGDPSNSFEGTDILWLAPNIGIVKSTRLNEAIVNATEELIAYSIP